MAHPSNAKGHEVNRWSTRPKAVGGGEIFHLDPGKLADMVDDLDTSGFSGSGPSVNIFAVAPSGG